MSTSVIENELRNAPSLELLGDNAMTWRNGEAFTAKMLGGGTCVGKLSTRTR